MNRKVKSFEQITACLFLQCAVSKVTTKWTNVRSAVGLGTGP